MKKKYVFMILILIQISIIGMLLQKIYNKKNVLGTNINPIKKDTIVSSQSAMLQYFYEPKANTNPKPEVIFPGLEHVTYTINKDSLNQKENYPIKKEKDTYRIITLGDSFTFGQNVNTEDNYPSQLHKLLNEKLVCTKKGEIEVLNLGVGGYDIQYTVERYKRRGEKYKPDVVIWLLIPDDFGRILELLYPKVQEYIQAAKKNGEYEDAISQGNYYAQWTQAKTDILTEFGGEEHILPIQEKHMQQLNSYYSGNLILVTFPDMPSNYLKLLEKFKNERKNTFIYTNLPHLGVIPGANLPDQHPSVKGNLLIAESVATYLLNNKMIPCTLK